MDFSRDYRERHYTAQDGLSLFCRDYGDPASTALPVLCLAGLTGNSKDYHDLACRLAPRRVLCLDYRGRGRSSYDPDHRHYEPRTYISDILQLLALTNTHRLVVVGTSLGGILAMILGAVQPSALAGVILNDIGPEIPAASTQRIGNYIGKIDPFPDWESATATLKANYGIAYPDLDDAGWRKVAETTFQVDAAQQVCSDYDPEIAKTLASAADEGGPRLWNFFRTLMQIPTLCIRGALSDVLTRETFDAMARTKPDLRRIEVANRGHTPLLDEPACVEAIDRLFADLGS